MMGPEIKNMVPEKPLRLMDRIKFLFNIRTERFKEWRKFDPSDYHMIISHVHSGKVNINPPCPIIPKFSDIAPDWPIVTEMKIQVDLDATNPNCWDGKNDVLVNQGIGESFDFSHFADDPAFEGPYIPGNIMCLAGKLKKVELSGDEVLTDEQAQAIFDLTAFLTGKSYGP